MDVFDLTMGKDYYVPLTRKEMIEKLEYYKGFANSLDKKYGFENKEYYELLDSLINLEISAFDIQFPANIIVPSILRDVLKYNVWQLTKNKVDKFNNRDIILTKEAENHGFIKAYKSVIADISLKPPYVWTKPSIFINSYETDYEVAKNKMLELRNTYEYLKNNLRECRFEELYSIYITEDEQRELEKIIERHMKLSEELEEARKLLNMYRKSLCLYKDGIYKEVAHALLEEYHIPHEEGKDLVKTLPWITLNKKSL